MLATAQELNSATIHILVAACQVPASVLAAHLRCVEASHHMIRAHLFLARLVLWPTGKMINTPYTMVVLKSYLTSNLGIRYKSASRMPLLSKDAIVRMGTCGGILSRKPPKE